MVASREEGSVAGAALTSRGTAVRPHGEAAGRRRCVESSDQEQLPLPPHAWSFSNPAFGLIYLGQGERNLGNLLKKLEIGIHIPNLLELFFCGFWISWQFLRICIHYTKSAEDALSSTPTPMID